MNQILFSGLLKANEDKIKDITNYNKHSNRFTKNQDVTENLKLELSSESGKIENQKIKKDKKDLDLEKVYNNYRIQKYERIVEPKSMEIAKIQIQKVIAKIQNLHNESNDLADIKNKLELDNNAKAKNNLEALKNELENVNVTVKLDEIVKEKLNKKTL